MLQQNWCSVLSFNSSCSLVPKDSMLSFVRQVFNARRLYSNFEVFSPWKINNPHLPNCTALEVMYESYLCTHMILGMQVFVSGLELGQSKKNFERVWGSLRKTLRNCQAAHQPSQTITSRISIILFTLRCGQIRMNLFSSSF